MMAPMLVVMLAVVLPAKVNSRLLGVCTKLTMKVLNAEPLPARTMLPTRVAAICVLLDDVGTTGVSTS